MTPLLHSTTILADKVQAAVSEPINPVRRKQIPSEAAVTDMFLDRLFLQQQQPLYRIFSKLGLT